MADGPAVDGPIVDGSITDPAVDGPIVDGSITDPDQLLAVILQLAHECAANGPTEWLADHGMRLGEHVLTQHARLSRNGILPTPWAAPATARPRPVSDAHLPGDDEAQETQTDAEWWEARAHITVTALRLAAALLPPTDPRVAVFDRTWRFIEDRYGDPGYMWPDAHTRPPAGEGLRSRHHGDPSGLPELARDDSEAPATRRIAGQVTALTAAQLADLAGREALVRVKGPDGTAAGRVLAWHAGPCLLVAAGPAGVIVVPSEPGWAVTELADEDAGYVTRDRLAAALDAAAVTFAIDLPDSVRVADTLLRALREEL